MTLNTLMHSPRMRLCSFPDGVEVDYGFCAHTLALKGYYWDDASLHCCYDDQCITPALAMINTKMQNVVHHCHTQRATSDIPLSRSGYYFLNYESHRILTFKQKKWPHTFIKSEELAAAGFYYTGDGDRTQCAFCPLSINRWEFGDTAYGEHMRWYSACPFIRGKPVGNFTRRAELDKIGGASFYTKNREMRKFIL